jgi:hypothetical protein
MQMRGRVQEERVDSMGWDTRDRLAREVLLMVFAALALLCWVCSCSFACECNDLRPQNETTKSIRG